MKLLAKSSFIVILSLFIFNISHAQEKKRAPYTALLVTDAKQKVHGKIIAINDTALVLVDKKEMTRAIAYQKIKKIKILKHHSDVGYAIVTGALVGGAIVAAQSVDDGAVAVLVGAGGTAAVAGLSIALHNVIHGAEIKIDADKEKIDYQNMSQKLSKYIFNDIALKP